MKLITLQLLSLITVVTTACKAQPILPTHSNDNTLLWEVTGNGLSQPSYFLGTMHILCQQDAWLSQSLQTVLDKVGVVYLEVDLDNMMEMVTSMGAMKMQDGKSLKDLVSEADYTLVKNYFTTEAPLPFSMLESFKPMLLSSMVAEKSMPCESVNGMEMMLMKETSSRKLEINGLETLAFQAGLFDSIPYELQANELVKGIKQMDSVNTEANNELDSLVLAYRQQDLALIDKLTNSGGEGIERKYLDLLLYKRNANWAEQFNGIASKGSTLFAVGAGHLPGQLGVLQLLKAKGYTLRPIVNIKMEHKANP